MSRYERRVADPDFDTAEKEAKDGLNVLFGICTLGLGPLLAKVFCKSAESEEPRVTQDNNNTHGL
ncbi:MAG: hypothetical protein ACRBDL_09750 [Alphaproteobacteria bacterium]